MSTELAASTDDFLLSFLKHEQDNAGHGKCIAKIDPKQFLLIARHAFEGGSEARKITEWLDQHNISRWTYYSIRNKMKMAPDYESQRACWALEAQADIDMVADTKRRLIDILARKLDDDDQVDAIDIKETSQAVQQVGRDLTNSIANYQKLTGAATIVVEKEIKVTLDEAAAYAAQTMKDAEVVDV